MSDVPFFALNFLVSQFFLSWNYLSVTVVIVKLSRPTLYLKCEYESTAYSIKLQALSHRLCWGRKKEMKKGRMKLVGDMASVSVTNYYIKKTGLV